MTWVGEVIDKWEPGVQMAFFITIAGITALLVLFLGISVSRTCRILIRGYPPAVEAKQECNHDDNLTGYCLKKGGCKTTDECNTIVGNNGAEK